MEEKRSLPFPRLKLAPRFFLLLTHIHTHTGTGFIYGIEPRTGLTPEHRVVCYFLSEPFRNYQRRFVIFPLIFHFAARASPRLSGGRKRMEAVSPRGLREI